MDGLLEHNKKYNWLKKHKRLFIGIATIIVVLMMILFVDFGKLIEKFVLIGFFGLFLFAILYSITFLFRAYKLKLIYKGIDRKVNFSTTYFSIGIAFVINDLTPAKVGDFAKIGVLKDQENITLNESLGTTIVERILDLGCLFIISLSALVYLYIFNPIDVQGLQIFGVTMQFYLALGAIILLGLFFFGLILLLKPEVILRIINKISSKLANYIRKFIQNFKIAYRTFKNHKKETLFIIILEGLIWIIESSIGIIFFYLLGYEINILIIMLSQIITFFSKTIPITPGGWAISENIGAFFIMLFYPQFLYSEILSIFIIDHLFRSGYLLFFGGYSIFHYNFRLKEIEEIKNEFSDELEKDIEPNKNHIV